MKNKMSISLKDLTEFCFFSSVAVLLSVPIIPLYSSVAPHIILAILAVIVFLREKESIVVKCLCVSVFFNSIYSLFILTYWNDFPVSFATFFDSLINKLILSVIIVGPIIYAFIKSDKHSSKLFLGIIATTLLLRIHNFGSYILYNFVFYILLISLILFFISSALDTNDDITRKISIGAAICASFIMFVAITGIIIKLCDKPENNWYGGLSDYYEIRYPIYTTCCSIFKYSSIGILAAGIIMGLYFANILKRSKTTLRNICIPAILSMIGFGGIYSYNSYRTSYYGYWGFGLWNEYSLIYIYIAVYIAMAYSFYKLHKIL